MRKKIWSVLCGFALLVGSPSHPVYGQEAAATRTPEAAAQSSSLYTVFGPPSGGNSMVPEGIDPQGTVIAGYYTTEATFRSFYRLANGTKRIITPPDVHCVGPDSQNLCVGISAIDSDGDITGYYQMASTAAAGFTVSGFLRDHDGHYATFNPANSVGTYPVAINSAGTIPGFYTTAQNKMPRGFVRDASGSITTFDTPDAVQGTYPASINSQGQIVGHSMSASGFLREPDGELMPIKISGSTQMFLQTINDEGQILGTYTDASGSSHCFLREADGTSALFNVPGASRTSPFDLDAHGNVVGFYQNFDNSVHGFYRLHDGTLVPFDPPGSVWTIAISINSQGVMVGYYLDANHESHGFLRKIQ